MMGPAKPQRIEIGDRACAHGEDVAQNAADAGSGTLIGLDVGGMVVALHLEDCGLAVPDIDHARVLALTLDHPGRLGRPLAPVPTRGLVCSVERRLGKACVCTFSARWCAST